MIWMTSKTSPVAAFVKWQRGARKGRQRATAVRSLAGLTAVVAGGLGVLAMSNRIAHTGVSGTNPNATVVAYRLQTEPLVAQVCRVVQDVTRKQALQCWKKAVRGETVVSGDRLKTGMHSAAVLKLTDNSFVRIRELSELTVTVVSTESSFLRSIDLEIGGVGFGVKKQGPEEEFRFTSPTSVASIRGTEGEFISTGMSDTLTIVEGAVVLTNSLTGENVMVRGGYTGIANHDGTIGVRPATADELNAAGMMERGEREPRQMVSHGGFDKRSINWRLYPAEGEHSGRALRRPPGRTPGYVPNLSSAISIVGVRRLALRFPSGYGEGLLSKNRTILRTLP